MFCTKVSKWWFLGIGLFLLLSPLLASCRAVNAPPTPSPTVSPSTSTAASPKPASTASPADAEWSKVVEAAKKEGKVTVYSYNMVGDVGSRVSEAFSAKYGIKVDIITGMGAALAERIKTEIRMGSVTADIMDANPFQISNVKAVGGTTSSAEIPVLSENVKWRVEPWASDPERHSILHTVTYASAFVNTNLVKAADEPHSFGDLAQPKWQGKIVIIDPAITSGATNIFPTLLRRNFISQETLLALGKNGISYSPNTSEASRQVLQGIFQVDLVDSPSSYSSLLGEQSIPIKPIAAEEGTTMTSLAMAVIKNSPHPNAARLLVNWLLTQEGQTVFAKAQRLTPVRSDVSDFLPGFLQIRPVRTVVNTLDDERENVKLFQEGWLAKLWKK